MSFFLTPETGSGLEQTMSKPDLIVFGFPHRTMARAARMVPVQNGADCTFHDSAA